MSGRTLTYRAAPGEANNLTVVMSQDRPAWTITDIGAPLNAGTGCSSGGQHTAFCALPEPLGGATVAINLGDKGDRAALENACSFLDGDGEYGGLCTERVRGGDGNDTLLGTSDRDDANTMHGGPGNDRLSGRGDLSGESGADALDGDCDGRLTGGKGADTVRADGAYHRVVYANRVKPVYVTLDGRRNDGAPHERDLVLVPNVIGGSGADVLVGDGRENRLAGGPGNDVVRSGGGRDTIYGDAEYRSRTGSGRSGADRLFGGSARDMVDGCGAGDVLHGGPGPDDLVGSSGADRLSAGLGDDRAFGGPGADRITGGHGSDELRGMSGNDVFHARDGRADDVDGERGFDRARVDRGLDRTRSPERFF